MQPAGGLVAGPGKIAMPLGPHLQHAGLVVGDHLPRGVWVYYRARTEALASLGALIGDPSS